MIKYILIALLALLATHTYISIQSTETPDLQLSEVTEKQNILKAYEEWKIKYGKSTSNSIDQDQYRFSVFTESYLKVEEHKQKKSTYKLGLNKFADVSDEEFNKIYVMTTKKEELKTKTTSEKSEDILKGNVNWKTKGAVSPVQDQGACGSCYTFATAAALEGASKLQSPYGLQKFSEQQIVSCSQDFGNDGCNGGWGSGSMEYIIKNGITLEANYPYVSGTDAYVPACDNNIKSTFFIQSYSNVVGQGHCAQIQKTVAQQPVYGRVTTNNWKLYTEGVFDNCSQDPNEIGHAITVIGYNTLNQNADQNYWLIKNSWGTGWGEDGYIKLKFGNTCSVCHEVFAPFY